MDAHGSYPSQCFSKRRHGHAKWHQNLTKMPTKTLARANDDGCTMTLTLTQSKKRVLAPVPPRGEPSFEAWDVDPGRQLYIDIYIYIYIYIYISIYNRRPGSTSQASKLGSPRGATGAKTRFLLCINVNVIVQPSVLALASALGSILEGLWYLFAWP